MPQAAKPAMISGPGAMSQRTDGGPASKQAIRYISGMPNYGDGQELANLQAAAPMSASGTPASQPAQVSGGEPAQQSQVIPIDAPTQRPGEPVTAGAASGPGPGPEVLHGTPQAEQQGYQNALVLLNQLGDNASVQVKQIRNALAAHMNNMAGIQK
jgi:hypothetical protein